MRSNKSMKTKIIEIHQRNMYCYKCLLNAIKAILSIGNVEMLDINMNGKNIKIKYRENNISKNKIQALINKAITTGSVN